MENSSNLVSYLNAQFEGGSGMHSEALSAVRSYREYYEGKVDIESVDGRSQVVHRDVLRVVEGSMPSLVDPFVASDIAVVEGENAESEPVGALHENLINYQWNKKNNPLETAELLGRNLMVDGTVWTKVGWSKDGYSTVEVVPFEAVIPDPSAYKVEDLKWVIYRRKVTISDILSNEEWFGKHTLESLQSLTTGGNSEYDPDKGVGREDFYSQGQRALEEIEVFEYYGEYDRSGNGKTEPIVAVWSQDMLLNDFPSPYPGFSIPFDNTVYVRRSFSIYGVGVGGIIGDKQTQRSALLRGVYDNMANSNNGTKFIRKGSLDAVNFNRLKRGEKYVELNVPTQMTAESLIYDGNFNPLPTDVYKMLDDIETDEENLTGITKYAVGSDSRSLNQTATGVSIISSMSQRRLVFIAQHISGLLQRVFKKWMMLNAEMLDMPSVEGIDLYVNAGVAGLREKKNNDIVSMIQAISNMPGSVDPKIMNSLIVELAENMGLDTTSKLLKDMKEEGEQNNADDPMKEIAIKMKLEAEQAKIAKDRALAQRNQALAQETMIDASIKSVGGVV